MTDLRSDQFIISLDKIYRLDKFYNNLKNFDENLFIKGNGTVIIYTSEKKPSSKTEMQLENTGVIGHKVFSSIPNYIYLELENGSIDEIIISGVKVKEI